ncbi:YdcF family protein [Pinirhizobacter sp.]|jgi:uncharacterized SAM-binding protein YcdF (DUF218 family)|uniref:YdcF family protein n=1 Tax=Pinirhizobacter sp. TaxID=2950432 RepID=UPI002F4204F7
MAHRSSLLKPFRRGVWRYLGDVDVLHGAAVTLVALAGTGGLLYVGYLLHVARVALRSPREPTRRLAVLVFGRMLVGNRPEHDYRQRLARGLLLAQRGLAERVMLLGGRSGGGTVTEAAAGERWLRDEGFPAMVPMQLEQASIDSLENLRHARSLLARDAGDLPPVCLVTSRYHLARCQLLARRLGFEVETVGAEATLPRDIRYLRRIFLEAGYLMWIDVAVRWARLIGHRRMADRVS